MRVLVVHNRYRSHLPSGENRIVDDEVAALRDAGVDVVTFIRSSDELATLPPRARIRAALGPIAGGPSRAALRARLREVRPQVVHLHNPYPLISPTVITDAVAMGIPVVATIHNFRLRCMNGLLFRDGAVCTECEDRVIPWPGVRHGCYRDSTTQSVVMATALARHGPAWSRVARFLAVSDFVARRLTAWGLPPERIRVKPNPVVDPGPPPPLGEGFCFAGRLAEEKGIRLLLDAWAASGLDGRLPLRIAGDGPLRDEVAARCAASASATYEGLRSADELRAIRTATAVQVMPSLWFEAHPAIAESFALGRPVVATATGALGDLVDPSVGWAVAPTPDALADALRAAAQPTAVHPRSMAARERFLSTYEAARVTRSLLAHYAAVAQ
ncbi:MAG: glycosyltransferase family 4 protein [Actinomycetota bacterium]